MCHSNVFKIIKFGTYEVEMKLQCVKHYIVYHLIYFISGSLKI